MKRWAARLPALLLLSVAAYYAILGGEYSVPDLLRLRSERASEEARLARATADADSLRLVAKLLESDRATIERLARERFGMIADGEILYRFVDVAPADSADSARMAATP